MKVLITGSSGHLGEALIRVLKKNNHVCIGIDINSSEFTSHVGSIMDQVFVKRCMKDVDAIIHTATLHKPHIATHTFDDFIDNNLKGTLVLLEEAYSNNVKSFIFTSTTSTFGDMLVPEENEPAIWITEETIPIPKNIYGVTKTSAEDLCQLFFRNYKLPCLILKTSRFFLEEDDNKEIRDLYEDLNIKANEFLYRRVDIEDVVSAHLLALEKAPTKGFGKYIISATSPFTQNDLIGLKKDVTSVLIKKFPNFKDLYKLKNWKMFNKIDRVYDNAKARKELNWKPKYDFAHVLNCLKEGIDFRSKLAIDVGVKGYHNQNFDERPYPTSKI